MSFLNQLLKTVFVIIILLSTHSEVVHAQTSGKFILLDGPHKFSAGDNPTWASREYDDSKWQQIKVPGSWQSQGIKPEKGMGWYRIRFKIPDGFNVYLPAVLIGRIGDVDEAFFNGVKIGGEGIIGDRFVEATKVERLYIVPRNLINYSKDNILAVRVMNTYLNGGIFDKGIAFGEYDLFMIEKLKREKVIIVIEYCLFTFFAMFFVASFFLYIKGLRDKEYIFFWLFISLYGLLVFLGSITFYSTGLKNLYVQETINILSAILPFVLCLLLVHMYQIKYYRHINFFLAIYFFIAAALPFFHGYTERTVLMTFWKITFILTALYIAYLSVKVYVRKFNESGPILLGVTGLVIGLILESVGGLDLLQTTGFFLWDYSTIFFMLCVMYALASRYTRIQNELRSSAAKIFDAHEDERRRVARELHDGVGQSLLSIKLKLKMLAANTKENKPLEKDIIPELISDLSGSIEELRTVAMDLRPSYIENAELADAIAWHSGNVQDTTGITINIQAGIISGLNIKIKENIYRIFQEALSNVVQHSQASKVDVILGMKEKMLLLEIKDNGKGFDPDRKGDGRKGIGLYTIRERIELMGGILRINSIPNKGTALSIEVPVG
jgi:signal transduction histidine kinase